jgi:hypothetical protein
MTSEGVARVARELPRPEGYRLTARLLSALGGGPVASTRDREEAAGIEARHPGTSAQVGYARGFHARAAGWAVTEGGARGLVVVPAGYPGRAGLGPPDPHRAALAAAPGARVVLADPDEEVALVADAARGADPRVSVLMSAAPDAEGLMGAEAVRCLPRPLCLLLPWALSYLDPGTAAGTLGAYGARLGAGAVVAVSWWVPDDSAAGEELMREWRGRVPGWGHSPGAVEGWLEAAGMEMARGGAAEARELLRPLSAAGAVARRRAPGRMMGAVARVR